MCLKLLSHPLQCIWSGYKTHFTMHLEWLFDSLPGALSGYLDPLYHVPSGYNYDPQPCAWTGYLTNLLCFWCSYLTLFLMYLKWPSDPCCHSFRKPVDLNCSSVKKWSGILTHFTRELDWFTFWTTIPRTWRGCLTHFQPERKAEMFGTTQSMLSPHLKKVLRHDATQTPNLKKPNIIFKAHPKNNILQ